jgi:hypothetical protein
MGTRTSASPSGSSSQTSLSMKWPSTSPITSSCCRANTSPAACPPKATWADISFHHEYLEGSFICREKPFPRAYDVRRYPFQREVSRNALKNPHQATPPPRAIPPFVGAVGTSPPLHRQTASLLPPSSWTKPPPGNPVISSARLRLLRITLPCPGSVPSALIL